MLTLPPVQRSFKIQRRDAGGYSISANGAPRSVNGGTFGQWRSVQRASG